MAAGRGRTSLGARATRLVLLGKPGSGKGTQAKRIANEQGVPQVSTGDLIRAAIASGSALGEKFRSYTDHGRLVPDDLVLRMVEERLGQDDCGAGFLLDGFPRTVPQAEALEAWLDEHGIPIQAAVNIEVDEPVLLERAVGRRFCPSCGATFHLRFAPPAREGICDACGHGPLEQRADDTREVVEARLREYRAKTEPLLSFYRQRGLLVEVDGVGTPEEVEQRITDVLGGSG